MEEEEPTPMDPPQSVRQEQPDQPEQPGQPPEPMGKTLREQILETGLFTEWW